MGRRPGPDHAAPGGPGSAAAAGSEEWWGCRGGEECLLEGHRDTEGDKTECRRIVQFEKVQLTSMYAMQKKSLTK